jgi:hypothetical protein
VLEAKRDKLTCMREGDGCTRPGGEVGEAESPGGLQTDLHPGRGLGQCVLENRDAAQHSGGRTGTSGGHRPSNFLFLLRTSCDLLHRFYWQFMGVGFGSTGVRLTLELAGRGYGGAYY